MVDSQNLALPSISLSCLTNRQRLPRRRRKVHHKVKTGCKACKARRQKCDEQAPICSGCSRFSTECVYSVQNHLPPEQKLSSHEVPSVNSTLSPRPTTGLSTSSPSGDLGDLELLHQFLTSTCIAPGQQPQMTLHVQTTIFPLAQAYPFVMRGIFAMAATHLSWLRPSRQAHYAMVAAKNHDDALPDFQSALRGINEENCHAIIFYSKSLLWCSMAWNGSTISELKTERYWLPQWFWLLRGSCQVVESSRTWIKDGPHVEYRPDSIVDCSSTLDDQHISTLTSELSLETGSTLCTSILSSLREAFARASIQYHSTPVRNAMNFWVGSLPDEYIALLQEKEPWALVTLAHFCVLVHRFETLWFMKGHATSLLLFIIENLDKMWRHYVLWPCRQLEIELSGSYGNSDL